MVGFFWRDSHIKIDYVLFGDLLVVKTTYWIDEYELICAPSVCKNHHVNNIMVSCGFSTDEKVESFIWLFNTSLDQRMA